MLWLHGRRSAHTRMVGCKELDLQIAQMRSDAHAHASKEAACAVNLCEMRMQAQRVVGPPKESPFNCTLLLLREMTLARSQRNTPLPCQPSPRKPPRGARSWHDGREVALSPLAHTLPRLPACSLAVDPLSLMCKFAYCSRGP